MRAFATNSWNRLVLLTALASLTWNAPASAQRPDDEYPAERRGSEPPRLMRGGLMQQLRSVTETVIGTPEERAAAAHEANPKLPSPPPLGAQRRPAEGRTPPDRSDRPDANGPQGRAWAGQFLIPNYRLRDQTGPTSSKPSSPGRQSSPARPSDSVEMMLNDDAEFDTPPERNARAAAPTPRVYLGQRSTAAPFGGRASQATSQSSGGAAVRTELNDLDEADVDNQDYGPTEYGAIADQSPVRRTAQLPRPPRSGEPVAATLSDRARASAAKSTVDPPAAEPNEVLVSPVPDIPYVPRKPLPKRGGAAANTATTPPQPVATPAKTPTPSSPSLSPSGPSPSGPSPSVPSVPSLELSKSPSMAADRSSNLASRPALPPSAATQPVESPAIAKPLVAAMTPPVSTPERELPANTALPSLPPTSLPPTSLPPTSLPPTSLPPSLVAIDSQATAINAGNTSALPTLPSFPAPSIPSPSSQAPSAVASTLPAPTSPELALPPVPKKLPAQTVSAPVGNAQTLAPPQASADALAQQRMQMEIPHVEVKLLGPGDLTAGMPTNYELLVQNSGRIDLSGLILRMETPAGTEIVASGAQAAGAEIERADDGACILTWQVSQVVAGGQARLPLQISAQTARNFAVAIEWTVLPQGGVNEIVVKKAELQVALEGPVDVERNISNSYRVKVSNPGSAVARQVKVKVATGAAANNQIDVGDLAPGQTEIIDMDLTFEKAGQVNIGVEAAADQQLNHAANIQVSVRQAILAAALSLPETVPLGTPLVANIQLTNSGDASARDVQAGMALPEGTKIAQLPVGMSYQDNKLLWDVKQLAPGQTMTVPVELVLVAPGTHEVTLAAVLPDGTATTAKSSTLVEAFADLKLLVNDPTSPAPVGAPVTYELNITNRGSREAHGLVIVAQFSDGIEPESAVGLGHRVVPGQVLFETLPSIAPGQTITLKVVARAAKAGVHRFRAEVRCDESEARLVEEESTRFIDTTGRIATQPGTTILR